MIFQDYYVKRGLFLFFLDVVPIRADYFRPLQTLVRFREWTSSAGTRCARVWETWYIIHSNAARLWSELLVSTFPSSAVDSPPDVDFIYMAGGFRGRGEKLLLWFTLAMYHWALVKTKELFLCFLALNLSPPSLPSRPLPRSLFPNTRHKFGLVCDC